MGKKNKKARAAKSDAGTDASTAGKADGGATQKREMPAQTKREVMTLINMLLERCSITFEQGAKEWKDFVLVYTLLEQVKKKQAGFAMKIPERELNFDAFMAWLKEEGVDVDNVSIGKFDQEGHGLKANRLIGEKEVFLCIPRKVMMTSETARNSVLGELIKEDRILQQMHNVSLALHLLCEKKNPESRWKPYIDILPETYTTPLYFSAVELQCMRGSPAMSEMLNQQRNIIRQYAYFYRLFNTSPGLEKDIPIRDFTFEDYRWAVSTVMTRQNKIPGINGQKSMLALIPLWDMCNHCNGHITTDYDDEKDTTVSYALKDFPEGEQVYIFYGPRRNSDFLLHNGFVYPRNENDKMTLKLGVSKNDPLYSLRAELLTRLNLLSSRIFQLHAGQEPVDTDIICFLRIFSMNEEELRERLTGDNASALTKQLRDYEIYVNKENELKAWSFLETRIMLLQKAYTTSLKEDEEQLKRPNLTDCERAGFLLLVGEKRILEKTLEFINRFKLRAEAYQEVKPVKKPEEEEEAGDGAGNEEDTLEEIQLAPEL